MPIRISNSDLEAMFTAFMAVSRSPYLYVSPYDPWRAAAEALVAEIEPRLSDGKRPIDDDLVNKCLSDLSIDPSLGETVSRVLGWYVSVDTKPQTFFAYLDAVLAQVEELPTDQTNYIEEHP